MKIGVISVVLVALGSVTKNFEKYVDKIGIKERTISVENSKRY